MRLESIRLTMDHKLYYVASPILHGRGRVGKVRVKGTFGAIDMNFQRANPKIVAHDIGEPKSQINHRSKSQF